MAPHVVHAVRSDAFAGVERYICDVTGPLLARGWLVTVIGGDPHLMAHHLPPRATHLAAASTREVVAALRSLPRPTVLHTHMTAAEFATLMAWPVRAPRWITTRHFASPRGSSPAAGLLGRIVSSRVDHEIAISEFVSRQLPERPPVLHNGVEDRPDVAGPRARQILVAQRLEPEKATSVALRAWELSGLVEQGWTLLIAGEGSERPSLESGAPPGCQFLGFVDTHQLRATAAVFVAPASAEPFGLSVVEAMAAGMAIIAVDGGAHGETLGSCGVLVPAGDPAGLGRAMRDLATSTAVRDELGSSARARQRAEFSLVHHVDRLERIYTDDRPAALSR